jgi:hypothetical protein
MYIIDDGRKLGRRSRRRRKKKRLKLRSSK